MELRRGESLAAGRADPGPPYVQQLAEPAVHRLSLSACVLSARPGGAVATTGLPFGRPSCFIPFCGADCNLGRRTRMDLGPPPQPADRYVRVRNRTGSRAAGTLRACGPLLGRGY